MSMVSRLRSQPLSSEPGLGKGRENEIAVRQGFRTGHGDGGCDAGTGDRRLPESPVTGECA